MLYDLEAMDVGFYSDEELAYFASAESEEHLGEEFEAWLDSLEPKDEDYFAELAARDHYAELMADKMMAA